MNYSEGRVLGRRLFGFGSTLALTVAGLLTSPVAQAEVTRTGYSPVVVASTGKCLDVAGASTAPGGAVHQWRCSFNANEQWTLQPFGGGYRVINQNSNQCLYVSGGSTVAGAPIVQNTCTGGAGELWNITPVAGGYQLVSLTSSLCASVLDDRTDDDAPFVQAACGTTANFTFSFSSGLIASTTVINLQAAHSGKCLNVSGNSTAAGATVGQYPCKAPPAIAQNEQWKLVPSGSNYQVKSVRSNLCLANGGSTSSGAGLIQSTCSTATSGLWALKPVGKVYQLVAKNSNLCLTVPNANQADVQTVQSTCGTALNQLWALSFATTPSSFTAVIPLSVNPISAANLPNGKLLMWSAYDEYTFGGDHGRTYTSVFDPANNSSTKVLVTNTGADMFCPGTTNLPDGRVLVNGGSSADNTSIYDEATNAWSASGLMKIPRGYQGNTLIPNGSVFTLGGSWSGGSGGKNGELWTNGVWNRLTGVSVEPFRGIGDSAFRDDNHMWLFSLSNGRIFHAGPSAAMHWVTTAGVGGVVNAGNRGDDPYSMNGNATLYAPNTIMKTGGAPAYEKKNATASTYVIQVNPATPSATVKKVAPMAYPRAFHTSVVLPNGHIVVVGGQTYPVPFSDSTSILVPEIWDSETQIFRQMKPMVTPRVYHSTALLLPDGRVYVGGGGQCGSTCSANHFNTEILSPPYLFNPDGSAATRPVISTAPTTASLGGTVDVTTTAPVVSFAIMRLSSVTHTVSNDQRRIPLAISATSGTNSYTLAVPADSGVVLPGYYMLFALNASGVPSVSTTLRIN